ncbi:DNA phosphorothioation system sulfurtransferase DndC [Spirulina subsalsa]|uniref:DNA phosphorothioation system sulfurtransferase DndC n=1 Tax=Spirulina subsalsa TaxID=54311 RepID=UPI0004744B27|nr:DNA phosphorothioation system sulfurtransferase DndC [Spirulina subsalsa]
MTPVQTSLFPPRGVTEFLDDIKFLSEEIQEFYLLDQIPWVIGYSGGKDSTALLQLVWYAIADLPIEKRIKHIDVITTDTRVENPIVSAWVRKSLAQIELAAKEQNMPISANLLQPPPETTYWSALIGKGYPAPRQKFRWCTGRLKIDPSNNFIRDVVRKNGETVLLLGTRKTESANRAAIMKKREETRFQERLCPNPSLPNSKLYTPIEAWRTDEVWLYLMQWENPWGHSNKDLFEMYRGSTADNECPLVVDTSTPSCGNSRFGCWVCTLVDSDKSLSAMIKNDHEKEWLQPLIDFRLELDIRNDRDKRDFRRLHGRVELFERNVNGEISVEPIPGPYTKYWREHWLRRVLQAQETIRNTAPDDMKDITLITTEELSEIRRIWVEEKYEFDDSVPRIYKEVTGKTFVDPRPGADEHSILGPDEWATLADICGEDAMHLELMSKLLGTERKYYTKARRSGILGDLEKCFETSSRSKEEAIQHAHYKWDIKQAIEAEDMTKLKDTLARAEAIPPRNNWADVKFGSSEKN